jgi:hypothetical protein
LKRVFVSFCLLVIDDGRVYEGDLGFGWAIWFGLDNPNAISVRILKSGPDSHLFANFLQKNGRKEERY